MRQIDWEYWYSIGRLVAIVAALLIGEYLQEALLYPDIAYMVRDAITLLFRRLNFTVIKVNSPKGIGVSFNDYARLITPTDPDVLHGALTAQCIVFSPFLALATDYFLHNYRKYIKGDKQQSGLKALIITGIILILFLPFTFFRFALILIIFLILWDSFLWPVHYFIGHDLIGTWILIPIIVLIYCFAMYRDNLKTQKDRIIKKSRNIYQKIRKRGEEKKRTPSHLLSD